MPYITINDANIHYESFGEDPSPSLHQNRAPVLLIHGSTIDGKTDWSDIAPELAKYYKVFVPDCRGHGHSNNPTTSYSFKELANDAATFIRAMGYERAHVIGHSNGGNVALVTLLEHPDVIQTCVPQAANAFVTEYLIEREPVLFDPERVERESPEWMNEMIALHGEVNGKEYWRDLLLLTVKEIITEPNYTPADLVKVTKPTLVIMGADDKVNAPDKHAQYISENIKGSELWIPEKTGHNVHKDRREDWLAKVLDFLERRGK
ncbi:MAG TPA: alpha/beta hydrolase [Anaerolineales bacterium]|nr:alpha/beta hydrolase [Anaerolineales bacterium]